MYVMFVFLTPLCSVVCSDNSRIMLNHDVFVATFFAF